MIKKHLIYHVGHIGCKMDNSVLIGKFLGQNAFKRKGKKAEY